MSDPYPVDGMDALVKERALEKVKHQASIRENAKAELKFRREKLINSKPEPIAGAPFPEDCVDRLNNNQVLEKILLNLTDPSDIVSAYYACNTFQEILRPKVLHEVLNILFDSKLGFNSETPIKEILNMRLVCKSWRRLVDKSLFEKKHDRYAHDPNLEDLDEYYDGYGHIINSRRLALHTLSQIKTATSMLSNMSPSERQPFLRELYIRLNWRPDEESARKETYMALSKFLETFGDSVWVFIFYGRGSCYAEICEMLCYWASLMPELKEIVIKTYRWCDHKDPPCIRRTGGLPFPSLPALRKCVIWDEDVEKMLLSEIIQSNPWILETEEMNIKTGHGHVYINQVSFKPEMVFIYTDCIHLALNSASWPLKELKLHVDPPYKSNSMLFSALEKYKDTLTNLDIRTHLSRRRL